MWATWTYSYNPDSYNHQDTKMMLERKSRYRYDNPDEVDDSNDQDQDDEEARVRERVLIDLSISIQLIVWSLMIGLVIVSILIVLCIKPFSDDLRLFYPRLGHFLFELYRSLLVVGVTSLVAYLTIPLDLTNGEVRQKFIFGTNSAHNFTQVAIRSIAAPIALLLTTYTISEAGSNLWTPSRS